MTAIPAALNMLALLALPWLMVGLINRTKALWAGRRGPPLLQAWFDVRRLLRKRPVYSSVTTLVFQAGPLMLLATTLVTGLLVPVLGSDPALAFEGDFVAVAYLWSLGRIFLMLAALDTGSAFEGMGASREATYAALVEPALFLALGTLALATGHTSLTFFLHLGWGAPAKTALALLVAFALFLWMQVESSRAPIDDPSTHLELTMIHEVMVLDHCGPDLAAIQTAAAMKLTLSASLVATLLNPVSTTEQPWLAMGVNLGLLLLLAIAVGCVESLMARLPMRAVPQYIMLALGLALAAGLLTTWAQLGFQ